MLGGQDAVARAQPQAVEDLRARRARSRTAPALGFGAGARAQNASTARPASAPGTACTTGEKPACGSGAATLSTLTLAGELRAHAPC